MLLLQLVLRLQLGLPDPLSPLTIKGENLPRVYWLNNPGRSQASASCRPALTRLLQLHAEDPQLAVQLVPAAVLWGRDAPRAKGSTRRCTSPNWPAPPLCFLWRYCAAAPWVMVSR